MQTRWIVVAALGALMTAGLPVYDVDARAPKSSITAVVNGHRVKFRPKQIASSHGTDTIAFGGGTRARHLGQTLRSLAVGCAVALSSDTFPVDGQYCTLGYAETKLARNPIIRQWSAAVDGVQVTIDSYDGYVVRGTFSGTLDPFPPDAGYGPISVQNGQFIIVFAQ